jgi:molecular chaperone GrpE
MMPGNNDASDAPTGPVEDDTSDTATDPSANVGEFESGANPEQATNPKSAQNLNQNPGQDTSSESAEQSTASASAEQTAGSGNGKSGGEAGFSNGANGSNSVEDPPETQGQFVDADDPQQDTDTAEEENSPESLQALLQKAEARASDNWDRLLRLQAEMENQRKRAQNDVQKARKFALEGIVGDLLPVKDSLEMGLAAAEAEDADPRSIVEGAELTLKMLAQVFEKNNIIEVNPVDEKFDPEFHQAMSMQEVDGKDPNTVTSVMQKGYTLNDRLVRPALVMVAK